MSDFLKNYSKTFSDIAEDVKNITDTREDVVITKDNYREWSDASLYTGEGLRSLGARLKFPYDFVKDIYNSNPKLSEEIINDRAEQFFSREGNASYLNRTFNGMVEGVVSSSYNKFDDDKVIDLLEGTSIENLNFRNNIITPSRFHVRGIDLNSRFSLDTDDGNVDRKSDMFFAYFIDNSMTGLSSFRVTLAIYRQVCTNGMIVGREKFTVARYIHKGGNDYKNDFVEALSFLEDKKEDLKALVRTLDVEKADKFNEMREDYKKKFLRTSLGIGEKPSERILELYGMYGGKTKWQLIQAVTEYARDVKDINRREFLETRAYNLVA